MFDIKDRENKAKYGIYWNIRFTYLSSNVGIGVVGILAAPVMMRTFL